MIVNNPYYYGGDLRFYDDLLKKLGATKPSAVVPCMSSGLITFAANANRFAEVDTLKVLNNADDARFVYYGSLMVKPYCSVFAVAGDALTALVLGDSSANRYILEQRNIAAADNLTADREFSYNSCAFTSIQVTTNITGGASFTYNLSLAFVGVKISY